MFCFLYFLVLYYFYRENNYVIMQVCIPISWSKHDALNTTVCRASSIPAGGGIFSGVWDRYQSGIMRNLGSYCFLLVI